MAASQRSMWARLLALGPWLLLVTIALQAVSILLSLTVRQGQQAFAVPPVFSSGATAVMSLAYAVVGGILTARLPRHPIGWLLTGVAMFTSLNSLAWIYVTNAYATLPPALPAAAEIGLVGQVVGTPIALVLLGLALSVFPDGRLLTPRWRWLPVAGIAGVVAFAIAAGLGSRDVPYFPGIPNPFFVEALPDALAVGLRALSAGIGLVLMMAAAWSLILRYRDAEEVRRQQLRWIAYAAVVAAVVSVLLIVVFNTTGSTGPGSRSAFALLLWIAFCLGITTIPIAALIAILRYRLYAIDRIINGTIVYFGLVAILAGIYAGMNDLMRRLFVTLTGEQSDAALVITTLVLAMTLTPIRQWLERLAERRFKTGKPDANAAAPTVQLDAATVDAVANRAADLAAERVLARLSTPIASSSADAHSPAVARPRKPKRTGR